MADTDARKGTWPELLYRFIEHYKWEPQHLRGTVEEFDARIRRQEVPLNFLLNMMLRCSSAQTVATILGAFEPQYELLSSDLELQFPWEAALVQPDVRLESRLARLFIEVKIDAAIKVDQVQKYLMLHREMSEKFGKKHQYLFFLTEKEFKKCWRPAANAEAYSDVQTFLTEQLALAGQDHRLATNDFSSVRFGAATWKTFSAALIAARSKLSSDRVVEIRMISDFLRDLQSRGLAGSPPDEVTQ